MHACSDQLTLQIIERQCNVVMVILMCNTEFTIISNVISLSLGHLSQS